MARNYTHRHDLVVVDGAFHGTGNLLVDISPRAFKASIEGKFMLSITNYYGKHIFVQHKTQHFFVPMMTKLDFYISRALS